MTGSVRCCTVEIADADGDRFSAALEVRANRCTEYAELIDVCRFNADDGIITEHIRADVQGCTGTIRRYECCVGYYYISDGVNEALQREWRQYKTINGNGVEVEKTNDSVVNLQKTTATMLKILADLRLKDPVPEPEKATDGYL